MTTSAQSQPTPWPLWPWPAWPFASSAPAASDELIQPINPGWTFGNLVSVTEQNSSSPDTERDIVAVESYGSQLGRVIDALAELITEQPEAIQNKPALRALIALRNKIEMIKSQSAAHRLERIAADLAQVKSTSKSEYQRLSQKLRNALHDQDQRSE
jgi:hypothetical protein